MKGIHEPVRPGVGRPVVLIPARFSASASALRYEAEVAARALVAAVFAAGGEPLLMHPAAPGGVADLDEVRARVRVADAVLLPGGGDLDPCWSGQQPHPAQYDVDLEQDAFDLAVGRVALEDGLPLLAICRGLQVVNVLLGGDTVQDMNDGVGAAGSGSGSGPGSGSGSGSGDHRHRRHRVNLDGPLDVSCYHHQALGRVGTGLEVAARAEDGVIEAVRLSAPSPYPGWFLGVQWHPEDTAVADPAQAALFESFVAAARSRPVPVDNFPRSVGAGS